MRMRWMILWLLALITPTASRGGPTAAAPENEALALAWMDIQTLDPLTRIFTRYIWLDDGKHTSYQATSLTVNDLSLNAPARLVPAIGQGKTVLLRVDLRTLVVDEAQLKNLVKAWEEFRFDPRFSLLITKDTLRFLEMEPVVSVPSWVKRKVPRYRHTDGQYYEWTWVRDGPVEQVRFSQSGLDVLRLPSEHLDRTTLVALVAATQSEVPVVSFRYFTVRALSTIKGHGLYKTIYGGLYYELAGIPRKNRRATDFDEFLESLGIVGDYRKLFDRLRSDQRVAVFRSDVTGKPRQVEVLPTLVGRDGRPIVSITNDPFDEDIDIGTHPVANLLNFKARGFEVIWSRANGLHGYAIYNEQGALVDEVPFNLASDSTIPRPHTQRLQPAISCKRCHRSEAGWRLLRNDVTDLTKILDIFGDVSDRHRDAIEQISRLRGLYAGNVEQVLLPRARDDFANAVLQATGPWQESKDQLNLVQLALGRQGEIYQEYVYDLVDARKAMVELGWDPVPGPLSPAEQLRSLLPPPPVPVLIDPRLGGLLAGKEIKRWDWDLIRNFVVTRIRAKEKQ